MVPEPRSVYALRFFILAAGLFTVAISLSTTLGRLFPADVLASPNQFSSAFAISTCLLAAGSTCMFFAVASVRRERQQRFRRWLIGGLVSGTFFVAFQTYALTCLVRQQPAEDAVTSAAAFVAVCAFLHGMHFVIALLFLSHVTVQAFAERYDHEYFWGVTVCAWFWHALALIWVAILFVMLIARLYG